MSERKCDEGCVLGPADIETWTDEEVLLLLGPKVLELRRARRAGQAPGVAPKGDE